MTRHLRSSLIVLASVAIVGIVLATPTLAGESSIKKLHKLVLCGISGGREISTGYDVGDRIDTADQQKNAKKVDGRKIAKLTYEETAKDFAAEGVTVIGFKDFYAAYEAVLKETTDKLAAGRAEVGKKQDAAALSGINAAMAGVAAGNPAMAAAQAAAKDGGPKGAAPGALTPEQMKGVMDNPNIPEGVKAALRKQMAGGQMPVVPGVEVQGIPAGMRDGTAASRLNAGQQQGQAAANMIKGQADMLLNLMKETGMPACKSMKRPGGKEQEPFFQVLDRLGADGYATPALQLTRTDHGVADAYAKATNAYSHATGNDASVVPQISLDATFNDKDGNQTFAGYKKQAPRSPNIKGKDSAELQRAYEAAIPAVVADLTGKLYK